MEAKKNQQADLETRRSLHFTVGLVISIALVTAAFEWRTALDPQVDVTVPAETAHKPVITPATIQHPPKPKVILPEVIEVAKEDEVVPDITFALPSLDEPVEAADIFTGPQDEETETPYLFVEEQPSFPGGTQAFYAYVSKHLRYPRKAAQRGIEGKVFVQFVVDADGTLSDIQIVKGIGGGCDEEAHRVIQQAPRWNPGKQRGRAVRVQMTLPITFKLQ